MVDSTRQLVGASAVVLFATLLVLGTAVSVGAATEASDRPTVRITGATTADGNTTVGVVLTSAPDGLAGYYVGLTVEAPDGARVVDARYPSAFGLTSAPEYSDGGRTVTLEAADVTDTVGPGATGIRLATVTVGNADADDLDLAIEPWQFDADDGSAFEPATDADTDAGNGDRSSGGNGGSTTDGGNGDGGGSDRGSTGDTGGHDATPDGPSNRPTSTPAAPTTEGGDRPSTVTTETDTAPSSSGIETDTASSSGGTETESVELSSLSLWPLAVVGAVVAVGLAALRLRRRA